MSKSIIPTLLCLLLFVSCNGGKSNRLPASTGQPYEVVLEGDTDSILTKILTEDVPGLPQSEPLCNLIQVKRGKARGSYLMVRTRIVVDVDPRYKGFSAKTTQDEDASPQTVIRIKAKSVEQLRAMFYNKVASKNGDASKNEDVSKNGALLRSIIDQSELKHLASVIQQNPAKQREVKRMFGLNMKIPAALDASKKVKGFLWLSNNASSGMQNLVIFRLKGSGCSEPNGWSISRDEINKVLRRNMLGETDNMYMQLATQEDETDRDLEVDDENQLETERGLWEMKGDAMGGPYLLKVLPMSRGRIVTPFSHNEQPGRIDSRIVIIAFVYAPEMKKRNLTKQLEAILSTISPDKRPSGEKQR